MASSGKQQTGEPLPSYAAVSALSLSRSTASFRQQRLCVCARRCGVGIAARTHVSAPVGGVSTPCVPLSVCADVEYVCVCVLAVSESERGDRFRVDDMIAPFITIPIMVSGVHKRLLFPRVDPFRNGRAFDIHVERVRVSVSP